MASEANGGGYRVDTWQATSILLTAIVFASLLYIVKFTLERKRRLDVFKELGIPGPEPSIFTGNLFEYTGNSMQSLDKWLTKYGNIFGYFLGTRPVIAVKDLDILKDVLIKNFSVFRDRPEPAIDSKPICCGLAIINGPRWKDTRSVLAPTFSGKKMRLMSGLMKESVDTFIDLIDEKCVGGESFDIYAMSQGLTMDVIGKCALALKVNCQNDPNDTLLVASRDFMRHAVNPAIKLALAFPIFAKMLQFINNHLVAGQMTTMIVNNLKKVISLRRENSAAHRQVDMLQLMLNAAQGQDSDDAPTSEASDKQSRLKYLSEDEIHGNAMTFVIAGFETTANALAYTFFLLARNQDIQDKLRAELQGQFSEESDYDEINSIDYLDRVFCESLRMYPPVVTFVSRKCSQTITVANGFKIPAGFYVQAPVYQIHHDPEIWPDPEKFDPDRFLPDLKAKMHPMAFLAFGAGPRNCIGMRFALLEAKLAIAKVISKYQLVFCDETEDPPATVVPTVTLNPANGVVLKAIKID